MPRRQVQQRRPFSSYTTISQLWLGDQDAADGLAAHFPAGDGPVMAGVKLSPDDALPFFGHQPTAIDQRLASAMTFAVQQAKRLMVRASTGISATSSPLPVGVDDAKMRHRIISLLAFSAASVALASRPFTPQRRAAINHDITRVIWLA